MADGQGLIRGMVVLNYLGQRLRDKLSALEGQTGKLWLLNAEGYWLLGPKPEDDWRFMFPERSQRRLADLSPQLWQQMQARRTGAHHSAASWIRFERIYPLRGENPQAASALSATPVDAERYDWTIAVELSKSAMQAAILHG